MIHKSFIPNPLELAEIVAQLIFDYSYRNSTCRYMKGVDDVLLFGSTLTGDAHDVDMVLIHSLPQLHEFGIVTRYDSELMDCVPNPDAKREDASWTSVDILDALGSPETENVLETRNAIFNLLFHLSSPRQEFVCYGHRFDRVRIGKHELVYPYSGQFAFPVIGEVYVDINDSEGTHQRIRALIEERITAKTARSKIDHELAVRGLCVNDRLDLHVMARYLLSSGAEEDRAMVITQCRDPTFWHSILTSGKLYNQETRKFDISVDQKYPEAYTLFRI